MSPQSTIRRASADRETSAPIWAWFQDGINPGEVDYVGGISKCGDRRVRTLLYEAANVMLTRYNGQLKLKDWAFAIARRSTMRKAQSRSGAPPRDHHARDAAGRNRVRVGLRPRKSTRQEAESSSHEERRPREGADDGVDFVARGQPWPTAISTEPPCTQLTPSSAERARRERRHPKASTAEEPPLDPLENGIRK